MVLQSVGGVHSVDIGVPGDPTTMHIINDTNKGESELRFNNANGAAILDLSLSGDNCGSIVMSDGQGRPALFIERSMHGQYSIDFLVDGRPAVGMGITKEDRPIMYVLGGEGADRSSRFMLDTNKEGYARAILLGKNGMPLVTINANDGTTPTVTINDSDANHILQLPAN
jgi:hypothetical protein